MTKINIAKEFSTSNALSFHRHATQNQPITPINDNTISRKLDSSVLLTTIEEIRNKEAIHFTCHDSPCLGVIELYIFKGYPH
jgi:hypothetical protein